MGATLGKEAPGSLKNLPTIVTCTPSACLMVRGVEMESNVVVLSRFWREGALFMKSNGKSQFNKTSSPDSTSNSRLRLVQLDPNLDRGLPEIHKNMFSRVNLLAATGESPIICFLNFLMSNSVNSFIESF